MNVNEISVSDLRQMFSDTIVRYNKNPVYIAHISNNRFVDCVNIGNGKEFTVAFDDVGWDFKPINTGYVNIQGFALFITRMPLRQFKQGLHHDNIKIKLNSNRDDGRLRKAYDRVRGLNCRPIYQMAKNIYPSIQQAIELLEDNNVEVAFDRQFAINSAGDLFYRSELVGNVDMETATPIFFKEFEFLRKAL